MALTGEILEITKDGIININEQIKIVKIFIAIQCKGFINIETCLM